MGHKTIFAVGIDLPGDDFEYIPFHSRRSLLDADIVIYAPILDYEVDAAEPHTKGKPLLTMASAARNRESLAHWRHEMGEALANGKQVLVLMAAPQEVCVRDTHSGALLELGSYEALPLAFRSLRAASGKKMKLAPGAAFLADWWRDFEALLKYETCFDLDSGTAAVTTRDGDKLVGALIGQGSGSLLLLPALELDSEAFTYCDTARHEFFWTDEALHCGKTLLKHVVDIAAAMQRHAARQPVPALQLAYAPDEAAPAWVAEERYLLQSEAAMLAEIAESQGRIEEMLAQIETLRQRMAEQQQRLPEARRFKGLLFATGAALEAAVSEALQLAGCEAVAGAPLNFVAGGERLLGVVEGNNHAAIGFERILRLEQALQDDFARDGVHTYAKGVLFVNPFCAIPPAERRELFAAKALAAAKRSGFALIHTPDLFRVVQYLEGSADSLYAGRVREAILSTCGDLVVFPTAPR